MFLKEKKDRLTKKEKILSQFWFGTQPIEEIAKISGASIPYVATVLQKEGCIHGYDDLYTPTNEPMNVYTKFFTNRLGFKTKAIAEKSIHFLRRFYSSFRKKGDRAGLYYSLEEESYSM